MRVLFFLAQALVAALASAQTWAWDDGETPFVVSPDSVVERMLYLAHPQKGERLVDLGSGDGRIVIAAAKRYGTQGLGVDIDPKLVRLASDNAKREGVDALARFEVRDLFETDLHGVDVVTMYLLPEVNRQLLPRLLDQLRPGARIVSHDYDLGDWPFDEMIELALAEKMVGPLGRSRIYLWVVPAQAAGHWVAELPELGGHWRFDVLQKYQELEVDARVGGSNAGAQMIVRGARMRGEEMRLAVTGLVGGKGYNLLFRGKVAGGRIDGDVRVSDGEQVRMLPWSAARQ
ncbi:MAG TPA: methyltransferase domain-containing protein [Burkholderiales bacterium]|nr:methyltransferase domain-containing protein [Burkholderiales bacterium]